MIIIDNIIYEAFMASDKARRMFQLTWILFRDVGFVTVTKGPTGACRETQIRDVVSRLKIQSQAGPEF